MSIASKDGRLVLLISSLLIVVPMVIFPAKLGMSLANGSFVYSGIEILYYGIVLFIFRPRTTLLKLLQGAGMTFLYRIILGTIFGLLIAIMYSVSLSAALTLGISRYLPAILLHILASPFAMRPLFAAIVGEETPARRLPARPQPRKAAEREDSGRIYPARVEPRATLAPERSGGEPRHDSSHLLDQNGFDRAVRYLGEHHAVMLAVVVDREGLTTASYRRGQWDPGDWGPLSLLFQQATESILKRNRETDIPDRLEMAFGTRKLTIVKASEFNLLVLANREEDDLLGIRIGQAADMIRKYASERYGHLMPSVTEEKYVRSTGRTE